MIITEVKQDDKITPGNLKLQSYSHPPLEAGEYVLKTKLTVNDALISSDNNFINNSLAFTVTAPRFALEASLIHSMYPVAGSTGAFHASLPHIIFTRKTLPWERTIDDVNDHKPWMALLVITEKELAEQRIVITERAVETINDGDTNLIHPRIQLAEWEKDNSKVKTIDMPLPFFKSIVPRNTELDFLAHNRQVDTSNKEEGGLDPKGWYSCIIANRLPQPAMVNHVFLVSLEKHGDVINGGKSFQPEEEKTIRLIILHRWSFTEAGATFQELIDNLKKNIKPLRVDLNAEAKKKISVASEKAFRYGYIPMNTDSRTGDKRVSWYRGPLVPVDISSPEKYQYKNADQALRFDAATGMFDISYATAWQLGRLLALQNSGFSMALQNWKTDYKRNKPLLVAKKILEANGAEAELSIDPDKLANIVNEAEKDELLTDYLLELWVQQKNNS